MSYFRLLLLAFSAFNYSASAATPTKPEEWNSITDRLGKKDYAVLDELKASNRLDDLYRLLNDARWKSLGENSAEIREMTKSRIRAMPGHAVHLADQIEALSGVRENWRRRELMLLSLQEIGTPEAVAQLGRFLFDHRNPDIDRWHPEYGAPPPSSNHTMAAWSIMVILKPEMNWEMPGGFKPRRDVPKVRAWWESEGGEPYRKLLAASGRTVHKEPDRAPGESGASASPPIFSAPKAIPPLKSPTSEGSVVREARTASIFESKWWLILDVLIAAAVIWVVRLAVKRWRQ